MGRFRMVKLRSLQAEVDKAKAFCETADLTC